MPKLAQTFAMTSAVIASQRCRRRSLRAHMIEVVRRAEPGDRIVPRHQLPENLEILAAPSAVAGRIKQQRPAAKRARPRHVDGELMIVQGQGTLELQRRGVGTDATLDAARAAADASAAQVNKLQAVLEQKQLTKITLDTLKVCSDLVGSTLGPGGSPVLIESQEHGVPQRRLKVVRRHLEPLFARQETSRR